ncbi:MAG: hypothetical protein KF686_19805 [Ramlibacter sp.]|nr:hypothetical protein [Ramlibacter sp.]MBX3659722.1 hypothetical protein [Ramlibacter sp.]
MRTSRKSRAGWGVYAAGGVLLAVFGREVHHALGSGGLFTIVLIVYLLLLRLAAKCVAYLLSESDSE